MTQMPDPEVQAPVAEHSALATRRAAAGVLGGIGAAAVALVAGASWSVAALSATDVAALIFVIWVWTTVGGAGPDATKRIARAEDASPIASEVILVGAAV